MGGKKPVFNKAALTEGTVQDRYGMVLLDVHV